MARAAAALQVHRPGPAGVLRGDGGVAAQRVMRPSVGHRQRDGAVTGQHVAERHPGHAQRLLQQQRWRAGAVDEEAGRMALAVGELHRLDALLAAVHAHHLAGHVAHAALQRRLLQQHGQPAGVELVAVADRRLVVGRVHQLGREVAVEQRRLHRAGLRHRLLREASLQQVEPVRGCCEAVEGRRDVEGVVERVLGCHAAAAPAVEADAVGQRRVGGREQRALGQAERLQRVAQRRHGGFLGAERGAVRRLDQCDGQGALARGAQRALQVAGGQPAGGAAADDDEGLDVGHSANSEKLRPRPYDCSRPARRRPGRGQGAPQDRHAARCGGPGGLCAGRQWQALGLRRAAQPPGGGEEGPTGAGCVGGLGGGAAVMEAPLVAKVRFELLPGEVSGKTRGYLSNVRPNHYIAELGYTVIGNVVFDDGTVALGEAASATISYVHHEPLARVLIPGLRYERQAAVALARFALREAAQRDAGQLRQRAAQPQRGEAAVDAVDVLVDVFEEQDRAAAVGEVGRAGEGREHAGHRAVEGDEAGLAVDGVDEAGQVAEAAEELGLAADEVVVELVDDAVAARAAGLTLRQRARYVARSREEIDMKLGLIALFTLALLCGCVSTTPSASLEDTKNCTAMVAGGFRKVADERSERFNGKVGEAVARCRGGDKAAAFRATPYVDWANYWATGDAGTLLPGTTGVGLHIGANGRGVDGALLDLEYQRMELIKFNLFDNSGTFTDYALGRDGVPGTAIKSWPSMRLPASSPFYAAVGGDGPQLCQGELIRWRQLSGICNDLVNPRMGSSGMLFARNVQFEATYPDASDDPLARNRHGDRLSLLQPDPQLISRKLFTRAQSDPSKCRDGQGLPGAAVEANCDYQKAPFFNVLAAFWIQFMTHDWFSHLEEGRNAPQWMPAVAAPALQRQPQGAGRRLERRQRHAAVQQHAGNEAAGHQQARADQPEDAVAGRDDGVAEHRQAGRADERRHQRDARPQRLLQVVLEPALRLQVQPEMLQPWRAQHALVARQQRMQQQEQPAHGPAAVGGAQCLQAEQRRGQRAHGGVDRLGAQAAVQRVVQRLRELRAELARGAEIAEPAEVRV
ncbi:hypothetical protein OSTOST_06475 [Ostertagia ostertagi]